MVTEQLALMHGCVAELVIGDDERPMLSPSGRPDRRRRWSHNNHLWETCPCAECRGRRDGTTPLVVETYSRQPE